ncbi:hypothetical protein ACIKT0_00015 [Hansschlegelia beijingensis]|uniref:hypothetical protein n=1 Tax=Hansschlegelia beijingensis TaxID=1133344 RepID=UPI00387EF3DE
MSEDDDRRNADRLAARARAEEAILREGEAERLKLARRLAKAVLTDPAELTAQRLRRIGEDGLKLLITELREPIFFRTDHDLEWKAPEPTAAARKAVGANQARSRPVAGKEKPTSSQLPRPTPSRRTGTRNEPSRSANASAGKATRKPGPAPTASFKGWWRDGRENPPAFEKEARRWGYTIGLSLLIVFLLLLGRFRI